MQSNAMVGVQLPMGRLPAVLNSTSVGQTFYSQDGELRARGKPNVESIKESGSKRGRYKRLGVTRLIIRKHPALDVWSDKALVPLLFLVVPF